MNQLVPIAAYGSPTLIAAAGERAQERFIEFFTPTFAIATPAAPTRKR